MRLFRIVTEVRRPRPEIIDSVGRFSVAVLSDAMMNLNTMSSEIKPMICGARICGPACTAVTRNGDFTVILKALQLAEAGDILVIDNQGDRQGTE